MFKVANLRSLQSKKHKLSDLIISVRLIVPRQRTRSVRLPNWAQHVTRADYLARCRIICCSDSLTHLGHDIPLLRPACVTMVPGARC